MENVKGFRLAIYSTSGLKKIRREIRRCLGKVMLRDFRRAKIRRDKFRRQNPPEIHRQKSAVEKSVARNPSPESVARNLSGKLWHWCRELMAPKSTRRRETKPKTTNHVCGKPPLLRPNVAHRLYLPMEQL